jgi:hypothetical protein
VTRRCPYSVMRQCGAPQHQDTRDGLAAHGHMTRFGLGSLRTVAVSPDFEPEAPQLPAMPYESPDACCFRAMHIPGRTTLGKLPGGSWRYRARSTVPGKYDVRGYIGVA